MINSKIPKLANFITFFILFMLLIFITNCGKKGPPIAPETIVPQAINNLKAAVNDKKVKLSWSIPKKNTNGSLLEDLAGFKLFRGKVSCKKCPPDWYFLVDIDCESPSKLYAKKNEEAEYIDHQVKAGKKYIYRIFSYNRRGNLSSDSNLAPIEIP